MSTGNYLNALEDAKKRGLLALEEENGWEVISNSKDDWKIESKPSEQLNCKQYRAIQKLKVSADVARDTLSFLPSGRRQEWDTDIKEIQEIEKINDNAVLYAYRMNSVAKGVISAREFITVGTMETIDNGFLIYACSVDYPEVKNGGNYVRGTNGFSMFKIERDSDATDLIRVYTVAEVDPKGKLPRYLVDSAMPKVLAGGITKWRAFLEKEGHLMS